MAVDRWAITGDDGPPQMDTDLFPLLAVPDVTAVYWLHIDVLKMI